MTQTSAAERLLQPGPEEQQLIADVGAWQVVATAWPAPGADPIVTGNLIADRTMIGLYLQEIMRPTDGPDFRRLDYLHYDRVEGRWKYVSMDTRLPVSIMPAESFDRELVLHFDPLGFIGFGSEVDGKMMRSDMHISHPGPDHTVKQQHFITSDGTGTKWLAMQYEYTRAD